MTHSEFYQDAWIRLTLEQSGVDYSKKNQPLRVQSLEQLMEDNWCPMFSKVLISRDDAIVQMMRNRLCLGSLRYGRFGDKEKAAKQDREEYIRRKIQILDETKNVECLIDVSNILLLESVESKLQLIFDYSFSEDPLILHRQFVNRLLSYYMSYSSSIDYIRSRIQYYLVKVHIKNERVTGKYFIDCQYGLLLSPDVVLQLYQEFKASGNALYLSIAIGLCHTLYNLYLELTEYTLSAIDDGYHIPTM